MLRATCLLTIWLCTCPALVAAADDLRAELDALGAKVSLNPAGQIVGVDLTSAWVSDADLAILARFPLLEHINLSYTKVTDLGLEQLAPLENVKVLDLYYAEFVSDLGIAHLKHWKKLERLNVRGTKVTSALFEHLAGMQQLRLLDVGHSRVNDDLFEVLDALPRLAHLSFGGNKMSGAALPLLKALPALKELSLSGQQRTDSGLWSVAVTDFNIGHVAEIKGLQLLDLGGTTITDRGVAELARLKNLKTLDLRRTRVTSTGLAALRSLPELQHLRLWQARGIDDAAIPNLLEIGSLQSLELSETSVTAAGLLGLTGRVSGKALAAGDAPIPVASAIPLTLADHRGLKHLYVGGLDITPEQLDALRKALPDCQVSWWPKPEVQEEPRRR